MSGAPKKPEPMRPRANPGFAGELVSDDAAIDALPRTNPDIANILPASTKVRSLVINPPQVSRHCGLDEVPRKKFTGSDLPDLTSEAKRSRKVSFWNED